MLLDMNSAQVSVLLFGLLFITGAYAPGSARKVMLSEAELTGHLTQAWNLYKAFVGAGETKAAGDVVGRSEFTFNSGAGGVTVTATCCTVDHQNRHVRCELPKNQLLPSSLTGRIDNKFVNHHSFRAPFFGGVRTPVLSLREDSDVLNYTDPPNYRFSFKFYEKPGVLESVLRQLRVLKFVRNLRLIE